MNSIQKLYKAAKQPEPTGKAGICRISGIASKGTSFDSWVKNTFTDRNSLLPGDIISCEALFCFNEASELIQQKTGRDKPQRFRTYSHLITKSGEWLCLTKANKETIAGLIKSGECDVVCLTDLGQKHIFFKNRTGFWQLDELHIPQDVSEFTRLHGLMIEMLCLGFGQGQIQSGKYYHSQIIKAGFENWQKIENQLAQHRGKPMFDFAAWLMFTHKNESE